MIDIQLLDFAGSLFLETKDWKIEPGFNKIYVSNRQGNAGILLKHKLKLSRYMRSFQHWGAMSELDRILKFGEMVDDKYTEFRYTCLKGRIFLRWGKLNDARKKFEEAFSLLEVKFTENDKVVLIQERKNRIRTGFGDPNWDSVILDYDEILLTNLFVVVLDFNRNLTEIPVDEIITKGIKLARVHDLEFDLINSLQIRAEIQVKFYNYTKAENDLREALDIIESSSNFGTNFELHSDILRSLIKVLGLSKKDNEAEEELERYANLIVVPDFPKLGMHVLLKADLNLNKGGISESYKYLQKLKHFYEKHPNQIIFTPQTILKYYFLYILQGIYLKKIKTKEEINSVFDSLSMQEVDEKDIKLYSKLAELEMTISMKNKFLSHEYKKILLYFENLLQTPNQQNWRYFMILTHLIRVVSIISSQVEVVRHNLKDLIEKFLPEVHNSSYTMLAIKLETINKIFISGVTKTKVWLKIC